jgi:hypothetical protein
MRPGRPRGTILAGMTKNPFVENLRSAADEATAHRAALQRSEALADELADATVARRRLETELAESKASEKKAERESRSLRREILAAETARSNARIREIFSETAEDLRASNAARRPVADFDEILETLQGSPDAQKLASLIISAAAKSRGAQPTGMIFRADASPSSRTLASQIINAGRRARNLPPLAESDETAPGTKSPKPRKLPGQSDQDDDENKDLEVDEDGRLKKAKKKKMPAADEDEDAETPDPDNKDPSAMTDPATFAAMVHAAAKKARGH